MFDPVSGKPVGVPYEPYWRCQRCGICVLESHEEPVVCGSSARGNPPDEFDVHSNRACPMEYVTPTAHCPIVVEPKPHHMTMLWIVITLTLIFIAFALSS